MTKEEAIKELEEDKALYMPKEWIENIDRDTPDGRLITALDMAIKALEKDLILDKVRVSDEEMKIAKRIFLTGGEPFSYTDPCKIARSIKEKYNVEIYVYTNAEPLERYLLTNDLYGIDGLTISIKSKGDERSFERIKHNIDHLKNRVYVFPGYHTKEKHVKRMWQEEFTPAPDSIFRRR